MAPSGDDSDPTPGGEQGSGDEGKEGRGATLPHEEDEEAVRGKAPGSMGATQAAAGVAPSEPYFGAAPGLIRRMSTIGNGIGGSASLPPASIDFSDLNNVVSAPTPGWCHVHLYPLPRFT